MNTKSKLKREHQQIDKASNVADVLTKKTPASESLI